MVLQSVIVLLAAVSMRETYQIIPSWPISFTPSSAVFVRSFSTARRVIQDRRTVSSTEQLTSYFLHRILPK